MDLKFIRTLEMRATAPGVDDASAKLNKLQAAHDGVSKSAAATATVTDRAAKSQLSLAAEVEKLERRFNPVIRAQQEFEKVERRLMAAAAAHPEMQGRANVVIAQAAQHYDRMAVSATESAKAMNTNVAASKLSRYELINLSRQVQDVGVSLASGQSPLMVLVQQGSQIADVFASSQTKMTDVFKTGIAWAGRFATSTAGAVTGVVAIGASALLAASSFGSAQREIAISLAGIGRGSGVAVNDILKIGQAASSITGLSVSEAREFASALAATGKIGADSIVQITKSAKDFAATLNIDVAEAGKLLATVFADPGKGVDVLAKRLGGINDIVSQNIKLLAEQQQRGAAQKALADATIPSLMKASQATGFWGASWTALSNVASNAWTAFGEGMSKITGIGQTQQAQLEQLQQKFANLAKTVAGSSPEWPLLERAKKDLADVGTELSKLQAKTQNADLLGGVEELNKLSVVGGDLARAFDPVAAKLREVNAELAIYDKLLSNPNREFLVKDIAGMERAAAAARDQSNFIKQAQQEYAGLSATAAVQLKLMEDQLNIAKALGGAYRLVAQEQAAINQLVAAGRGQEEAQVIAAKQREISQAQINTQARETLAGLRDQFAVASAVTGVEKIRAQAVATTVQMLRDGVDPSIAVAVGAQQMANSFAAVEASARGALLALNDQLSVVQAAGTSARFQAQEQATINQLTREGVSLATARAVAEAQTAIVKQNEVNQTQQLLLASREALNVASARTGAERIQAQLLADIAAARRQYAGNDLAQTQAIEAAWNKARAAVEKVNSAILDQVHVLEQDSQMIQARLDGATKEELARLKAAQAYENAIRQGASAWAASALSASVLKNEMLKIEEAVMRTANQMGGLVRGLGVQRAELQVTEESGGVGSGAWMTGLAQQAMIDNMRKRMKEFEENISKHFGTQVDVVLSSGGSLKQAIDQLRANPLSMQGAGLDTLTDLYKRLGEEDKAGAIGGMQQLIAELQMLPRTLARDDQMKNLKNAIESLTDSTDALNSTMQVGLDPIFTAGHEALRIGYFNSGGSRNNNSGMTFDAPQVIGAPTVPALPAPLPMPMPGPSPIGPMAPWNYFGAAIRAANGLEGTVAGSGGVDSRELRVMVTPGELVRITTPAQQMQPTKTSEPDRRTTELLQELVTISKEPRFRERRRPGSHETRLSPRQRMQGF